MSHDSTPGTSTDNFWPEITSDSNVSADSSVSSSAPRSLTLDTFQASADGRLLEVTSQLDLIRTRLNSLEQFILEAPLNSSIDESVHTRIAEMELSIITTASRFDELASRLVESDETVATTVITTVDGFDTRIALIEDARLAQASELNELTGYLEQAFTRITELAAIIETNNDLHLTRFVDLEGQLEDTQTRASISALENAVSDINKRSEEAGVQMDTRFSEVHEAATAPLIELEARIAAHEDKLLAFSEQIRETEVKASEQGVTIDEQRSHIQQQTERLDTHEHELGLQYNDIASLQSNESTRAGEIEGLNETLGTHTSQIQAHEQAITEIQTQLDAAHAGNEQDLDTHTSQIQAHEQAITEIQTQLKDVQSRSEQDDAEGVAEQLARNNGDRITSIAGTTELLGQRIDLTDSTNQEIAQRAAANLDAIGEVQNRLDQLEVAPPEVVTNTSQIESELEATNSRVADVESTTRELTDALQAENQTLRAELTGLSDRIEEVDATAATAIPTNTTSDTRVDEIADSATEARELAENLRAIQAEVVQTMKRELNTHAARLVELEDSSSSASDKLNSFADTHASAERLTQLETKLVEALQTISQLTQLQRRHTTVETQLAEALGESNRGVEHTQQHVLLLRSELEKANARIARLEQTLATTANQQVAGAVAAATPVAAQAPSPEPVEVPTTTTETPQASQEATPGAVDTDWFDESFDERRAS